MQSLSPGPDTFTSDRIERVIRDDDFLSQLGEESRVFGCDGWAFSMEHGLNRAYRGSARIARGETFAQELFAQVQDPEDHLQRLDAVFSRMIERRWHLNERVEGAVARVCDLLTRLPERPLELMDFSDDIPQQYFLSNVSEPLSFNSPLKPTWDALRVVAFLSTNVIRIALVDVLNAGMSQLFTGFLNATAELLDVASQFSEKAESQLDRQRWLIVRAFLWASWQRSQMLYFSRLLRHYLEYGFDKRSSIDLILRGAFPSPRLSIQKMSRRYAGSKKAKFMCSWAFELLRTDAVSSAGLDFRRFHERYSQLFGNHAARCVLGSSEPCDGKLPEHCQRFKGMVIEDQSMHLPKCPRDCMKLRWDEQSYRAVSGARAVSLADTDCRSDRLRYCQASKETLAVSHVWSHGQGGRPEDGMNECLHQRYKSIAQSLGCDSYWMDAPCIPKDHKLRRESIARINEVFERGKATLVCDADLMQIRESIIACVLVCDWSVRAWTFLEAIRGRHQIYLLCKDEQIVPFKETLAIVLQEGSIDLAILAFAVPHLLPPGMVNTINPEEWKGLLHPFGHGNQGYLPVESAGSLLSHRETT